MEGQSLIAKVDAGSFFAQGCFNAYLQETPAAQAFNWQTVTLLLRERPTLPPFDTLSARLRQDYPKNERVTCLIHAIAIWDLCVALPKASFTKPRVTQDLMALVRDHQLDGQVLEACVKAWASTQAFYEAAEHRVSCWVGEDRIACKLKTFEPTDSYDEYYRWVTKLRAWQLNEQGELKSCSYTAMRCSFWKLNPFKLPFHSNTYGPLLAAAETVRRAQPFALTPHLTEGADGVEHFQVLVDKLAADEFMGLLNGLALLSDKAQSQSLAAQVMTTLTAQLAACRFYDLLNALEQPKLVYGPAGWINTFLQVLEQHQQFVGHEQRNAAARLGTLLLGDTSDSALQRMQPRFLSRLRSLGCVPSDAKAYQSYLLHWFERSGHEKDNLAVLRTIPEWKILGEILRISWPRLLTAEREEVLRHTSEEHWEQEGCLSILNSKELAKLRAKHDLPVSLKH